MAQLDPSRYKRLTRPMDYGVSDGLYWDSTNSEMVIVIDDTVKLKVPLSQTADRALVSDGTDIEPSTLAGGALSLASQARGDIIRRGASAWEVLSAKTSGQLLIGDGADIASTALSGDVTVNGSGVTAIGSGKVLSSMVEAPLIKYTKVVVSSAEILAINATPKTIVAAPGAGFTTIVHKALLVLNYNSAAYANNGLLGLYETNAAGALLTGTLTLASFLAQTADTQKELVPNISTTTGLTRLDNKAIVLTQATGESITGDSPVDVHCWYSTVPNGL